MSASPSPLPPPSPSLPPPPPLSPSPSPTSPAAAVVPRHWTPEQALAVAECLQALRQALWAAYGPQMQQAWREQLMPDQAPPEFDPDEPF